MLSYGETSTSALSFPDLVHLLRNYYENEVGEWLGMAGSQEQEFTLEEWKHMLS